LFSSCNDNVEVDSKINQKGLVDSLLIQLRSIDNDEELLLAVDSCSRLPSLSRSDTLLAGFYQNAGMLFYSKSDYPNSQLYFSKAYNLYSKLEMFLQAAQMRANGAVIKELQGEYQEAISMYLETLDFFKVSRDSISISKIYTNIAVVYEELGIAEKALEYNKLALDIKRLNGNPSEAASNVNNIGVIYDELLNEPDSAEKYYRNALAIYEKAKIPVRCATTMNNLGRVLIDQERIPDARLVLQKALHLFDSINNQHGKANALRNLGEIENIEDNYELAERYYIDAGNIYDQLNDIKGNLDITELKAANQMDAGNFKEAALLLKKFNFLKDSVTSFENKELIADMEAKYLVREKNKEIEMLELKNEIKSNEIENKNWLIVLFSIIFILLLIVIYFILRRNKLRQRQLRLEIQNYLLQVEELKTNIEYGEENYDSIPADLLKNYDITNRESEVLKLISKGYSNSEIAEKLYVSTNTVKTHIKNIYVKLDVKNRVEAIRKIDLS
jgi:ATP/maltotriose-dependent transcriptional regulator MalT